MIQFFGHCLYLNEETMEKTKSPHKINRLALVSLITGGLPIITWLLFMLILLTSRTVLMVYFVNYSQLLFRILAIIVIATVIFAVLAITTGIVSILHIRKSGQSGNVFAITGFILGSLSLNLLLMYALVILPWFY